MRDDDTLLMRIRDLIFPSLLKKVRPGDMEHFKMDAATLAEITYTQIMALGYNYGDINRALADLLPSRNLVVYPLSAQEEAANMAMHLSIVCRDYKRELSAFQTYHEMRLVHTPHSEILEAVSEALSAG
jgi:hypothetical protein